MMFLIATAAAHVPHDAILAVAPPLTLTAAEPWYMTMSPHGTALFYESDSGGTTWDLLGGPHTGTELVGLARLADGSLAALTGPSVWVSADGRAWTNAVLPETAAAVQGVGNEVAFAGDTCLWTGPALGPYTCAVTGAVTALGPDAAVVDGHVVAFDGTTWNDVDAPASDLSAVLSTGDTTFAGTASGELFRYDGAWTACGAIPAGDARYPDIVRLAWTGDALLVATATVGPYRSEDACASFEDRGTGEPVLYGQEGGPGGVSEATVFLAGEGEDWVTAGWAGLYVTADAGASWTEAPVFTADYVRGLAFAPDFPSDPHLYVGGYAAAIERTADGAATWDAPSHGLEFANAQVIEVSPADSSRIYGVLGHVYYASDDHGANWEPFAEDIPFAGGITAFPDPGRVWVWGGGTLEETEDDGDSWGPVPSVERVLGPGLVGATWYGDDATKLGRVCASAVEPVGLACGDLEGANWAIWYAEDSVEVTAPVVWPSPTETQRVLFAVDGHALAFDVDGATVAEVALDPDDLPHRLVAAPTGAVFLATRAGKIWRTLDGGDSWEALDLRLPGAPSGVAVRPDFATHPEVLFGTHDGLWRLEDADGDTPTLTRFQGHQRIDDASDFLVCADCPERTVDTTASMDSVQGLPDGAVAEAWVKGTRVTVTGEGGDVEATVRIDGTESTVSAGAAFGTLVDVDGLADGWHQVELVGSGTTGWRVDAIDAWRNDAVLADVEGGDTGDTAADDTATDDTAADDTGSDGPTDSGDKPGDPPSSRFRCACGGGEPATGLELLLAAWVVARRRARNPPTSSGSA